MRSRYERRLALDLKDALSRIHRLEMAIDMLHDGQEHQKARLEKLSTRIGGALGGRPPKAPASNPDSIEEIPKGDKRALRAYFKLNPPKGDH